MLAIHEIAHHRNGVSGAPFHVVTFTDKQVPRVRLVAVVMEGMEDEEYVAVFDRDLIGQGIIEFGVNSWRGDRYSRELRAAIDKWEDARAVA